MEFHRQTSSDCESDGGSSCSSSSSSSSWMSSGKLRVVVLGASGVGKTCLIHQFLHGRLPPSYTPTLEDMHRCSHLMTSQGQSLSLDLIDTCGSDEFPAMRRLAIHRADAVMLVYVKGDETSLEKARQLYDEVIENSREEDLPVVVVANKTDLNCDIAAHMESLSLKSSVIFDWGLCHATASAKESTGVSSVFQRLLEQCGIRVELSQLEAK